MRASAFLFGILLVAMLILGSSIVHAGDYDPRFVRHYPPGFHGMWYKAQRFTDRSDTEAAAQELYRWDKFMSRIMEVRYPYYPIPYGWEYGTDRTFNLPNYNANDWRR
jgi:hypothetical protein